MRNRIITCTLALALVGSAQATVYLNEIFINPPGSYDDTREYIELYGTPGKKLDGYAVVLLNGMEQKYWPLGAPFPADQEIDELFSLDGLSLGRNGLLVIGVGTRVRYSTLLADTSFHCWSGDYAASPIQYPLWNGGLDTPGKMQNDGSNTIMLIRNRPGRTQADPLNPAGLRWGKDIDHDGEYAHRVEDPQNPGQFFDQWGDGSLDKGEYWCVCVGGTDDGLPCDDGCPGGMAVSGSTLDLRGASTPDDVSDDLEVVDEVSYEHGRGWEYDVDDRRVDLGSPVKPLPERRVHTLDDPQGFNPDALTRVDGRKTGPGWAPAPGATGAMANGNNWQDTATEQWIRGETDLGTFGAGSAPRFFYSSVSYTDPSDPGVQPYRTNVPLWLADGVAPDFDFTTVEGSDATQDARTSYQLMAGRVNPLAIPHIPGDVNRDGVCDQADIDLLAAVFGDDDWVFSNSFAAAPEGDSGDPATQVRPWDVDQTGDNGIEASDLQWTLNFEGDTTGRIVGVDYDGTGPSATGVTLNPAGPVLVSVSTAVDHAAPSVGQLIQLTVSGAVLTGQPDTGIMQYVQDVLISHPGVLEVVAVTPAGPFATTRAALQTPLGTGGDAGVSTVNGYTKSFTQGTGAVPAALYTVTLRAIGEGTAQIGVAPAAAAKFAASTPGGVKTGRTDNHGNPGLVTYAAPVTVTVSGVSVVCADTNCDGVVDTADIDNFVYVVVNGTAAPGCPTSLEAADTNGDGVVDTADIDSFVAAVVSGGCQ